MHIYIIIFYNYNERRWYTQEEDNTESQLLQLQVEQIQADGAHAQRKESLHLHVISTHL